MASVGPQLAAASLTLGIAVAVAFFALRRIKPSPRSREEDPPENPPAHHRPPHQPQSSSSLGTGITATGIPVMGSRLPPAPSQAPRQRPMPPSPGPTLGGLSSLSSTSVIPSMEDLVRLREQTQADNLAQRPIEVLESLAEGNARFWMCQATRPELNAMERRSEIWQVFPKVAILGCSDSRVPPEIMCACQSSPHSWR